MMMTSAAQQTLLHKIAQLLREHVHIEGAKQPLGAMGIFHCRHSQTLHHVPLHHPGLVMVIAGCKRIFNERRTLDYQRGQLFLYPAGANLHFANLPEPGGDYLALAVNFPPDILERFIQNYSTQLNLWQQLPRDIATATDDILLMFHQWLEWCIHTNGSTLMQQHRVEELLLLLAHNNLAGNIFAQQHPGWRQKVAACFAVDIARDWRMEEIAARFGCSDATLRRRLDGENCSFRQLLEEVRLTSGLALLQESNWTVQRVAQAVGYESPSRFSERFRLHFGMTPQALRLTRLDKQRAVS